jgi:hypothetical protein
MQVWVFTSEDCYEPAGVLIGTEDEAKQVQREAMISMYGADPNDWNQDRADRHYGYTAMTVETFTEYMARLKE